MESFEVIYSRCLSYYKEQGNNVENLTKDYGKPKGELFGDSDFTWSDLKDGDYIEEKEFSGKDIVLPAGEINCGARDWTKVFLKAHPQFEYFSFWDEVILLQEMRKKESYHGNKFRLDHPTQFWFESKIKIAQKMTEFINKSKGQIIIYAYLMEIPFRAAFIKYLRQFGFKIHIVYFPFEYVLRNFISNTEKASVEEYLYERYTRNFRERYWKEGRSAELCDIRLNIMELTCKKRQARQEEVYKKYLKEREVQQKVSRDIYALRGDYVLWDSIEQDWNMLWFEGADKGYMMDSGDLKKLSNRRR